MHRGRIENSQDDAFRSPLASTVIPLRQAAVESSLKRAAFDYASVAMLCVNGAGQILALNAEASELVGGDSPIGRSVAEIASTGGKSAKATESTLTRARLAFARVFELLAKRRGGAT